MANWVKFTTVLIALLESFSATMAAPTLVEQWLTHSMERREWQAPLSEPSRHRRSFDEVEEARERSKIAHRASDGILRNTLQDAIHQAAPRTARTVQKISQNFSNQRAVFSENHETPMELRYGYNLFEDVARAEFIHGDGTYGMQLENVFMWDDPRRIVRVRCFTEHQLDSRGTRARIDYFSHDRTVSLSVARPLSPAVSARLEVISFHRGGTNMAFSQAGVSLIIQNTSL